MATVDIIKTLMKRYPKGMKELVLEIKSCSAFMFDIYERKGTASPHHKFQIFHYLKSKDMDEGHIVYVCRDDARLLEVPIKNPSDTEKGYKEDIERISYHIKNGIMPEKEKPIVFDEEFGRFSASWRAGYSNYLTMLYGFENQMEFDEKYKPIAERWNRVLSRIAEGKEMTKNNLEALDEIGQAGFDINKIKESLKE